MGRRELTIDGKAYTLGQLLREVRTVVPDMSETALYARLRAGDDSIARLARPISRACSRSRKQSAQKKRDEMSEVIARLGPRRRY